jgi:hypothetical protein
MKINAFRSFCNAQVDDKDVEIIVLRAKDERFFATKDKALLYIRVCCELCKCTSTYKFGGEYSW